MKIVVSIFFLFLSFNSFSFVTTKSVYGHDVKWSIRGDSVNLAVNPNPIGTKITNISSTKVQQIISESIASWNQKSSYKINESYSTSLPAVGVSNTLRFSSDPTFFGDAVLAVTSVNHNSTTGEIFSADILINESSSNSITYTSDSNLSGENYAYLGDIVSHELGHFFGLSHSEVVGATMVYSVFEGQHSIHDDEEAGLHDLYQSGTNQGEISGKVVGGNAIGVFGSQVQAISTKTGKVISGVLTDTEGNFKIDNLPIDDAYVIYVLPTRDKNNLGSYYKSVQSEYCSNGTFVASFYSKCGGRYEGKPQVFRLSDDAKELSVGNITIKCSTDVRDDYLYEKLQSERNPVTIYEYENSPNQADLGEAYIGYFSDEEVALEGLAAGDKLLLDIRNYSLLSSGTNYLQLKLLSSEIGSAFGFDISITDAAGNTYSQQSAASGSLSGEMGLQVDIPLSSISADNLFEVHIKPISYTSSEKNELFSSNTLVNKTSTYLLLSNVLNEYGSTLSYTSKNSYPYLDNLECSEGDITEAVRANSTISTASSGSGSSGGIQTNSLEGQGVSCGTIDLDGDGPKGGFGNFLFGLLAMSLFLAVNKKTQEFFV